MSRRSRARYHCLRRASESRCPADCASHCGKLPLRFVKPHFFPWARRDQQRSLICWAQCPPAPRAVEARPRRCSLKRSCHQSRRRRLPRPAVSCRTKGFLLTTSPIQSPESAQTGQIISRKSFEWNILTSNSFRWKILRGEIFSTLYFQYFAGHGGGGAGVPTGHVVPIWENRWKAVQINGRVNSEMFVHGLDRITRGTFASSLPYLGVKAVSARPQARRSDERAIREGARHERKYNWIWWP